MTNNRTHFGWIAFLVIFATSLAACGSPGDAADDALDVSGGSSPTDHETPATAPNEGASEETAIPFEVCGPAAHKVFNSQDDVLGGYEGWWNSEPAEKNPSKWPSKMIEHPAVVLVDTTDGRLLEAYDRSGCTSFSELQIQADGSWPTDSVAIVDLKTLATIETFPQAHLEGGDY